MGWTCGLNTNWRRFFFIFPQFLVNCDDFPKIGHSACLWRASLLKNIRNENDGQIFGEKMKKKFDLVIQLAFTVWSERLLYKVAPPELKISPEMYFVIHNSVVLSKILKIVVPFWPCLFYVDYYQNKQFYIPYRCI